jgi:CRP-like cAMP-binding protein
MLRARVLRAACGEQLHALQPLYVHPGETLITQGGVDTECYLMIKGALDVYYRPRHTPIGGPAVPSSTEMPETLATKMANSMAKAASFVNASTRAEPSTSEKGKSGPQLVAQLGPGDIVGEILPLSTEIFENESEPAEADVFNETRVSSRSGRQSSRGPMRIGAPAMNLPPSPRSKRRRRLRTASVVAVDHCELFSIDGEQLACIVGSFDSVRDDIVSLARERLEMLGTSAATERARTRHAPGTPCHAALTGRARSTLAQPTSTSSRATIRRRQ